MRELYHSHGGDGPLVAVHTGNKDVYDSSSSGSNSPSSRSSSNSIEIVVDLAAPGLLYSVL